MTPALDVLIEEFRGRYYRRGSTHVSLTTAISGAEPLSLSWPRAVSDGCRKT